MKNKLKIIGNVSIYCNGNSYGDYSEIVSPIKQKIITNEIKPLSVKYCDDFTKEYYPVSKDKSWGSNLDEFVLKLDGNLNLEIEHHKIDSWSEFNYRKFVFSVKVKSPIDMLILFKSEIERKFYQKCFDLRQQEIQSEEDKRIKEIGIELLKNKTP